MQVRVQLVPERPLEIMLPAAAAWQTLTAALLLLRLDLQWRGQAMASLHVMRLNVQHNHVQLDCTMLVALAAAYAAPAPGA